MNNSDINEEINNIEFDKNLSIILIVTGFLNIIGDNILTEGLETNNIDLQQNSSNYFFISLILTILVNIILVSRNYEFYIQKKNSGQNADLELTRLLGNILILIGSLLVFYYFYKTDFNNDGTPVI